jgi:tetratricopeptide (TPR) repeat protein
MKCLEKDRTRRYATANDLAADVQRYLNDEPVTAGPPSKLYRLRKTLRRHRGPVAAAAAFLVLLTGATVVSTVFWQRAERASDDARGQATRAEQVSGFLQRMLASLTPESTLGRDPTILRELLDSAAARIEGGELFGAPEAEIRLRLTLADTYMLIRAPVPADTLIRRALELARSELGEDHVEVAAALQLLGHIELERDRSREALDVHLAALSILDRLGIGDHPDRLHNLKDVAACLQALGRVREARPHFEQALQMAQRLHAGDHGDVAGAFNGLGSCLLSLGHLADALSAYEQALAMRRRLCPRDHPGVAADLDNVGNCLRELGRPIEALVLYEDALGIHSRLFGAENQASMESLAHIAHCQFDLGRLDEALSNYYAEHSRVDI